LESRVVLSNYYVSPSGDDGNDGASPDTAWQSLTKVNSSTFQAGDSILFQGGATFAGTLSVNPAQEPGVPDNPITFGSYGTGRALISSGTDRGLSATNTGGLIISNLNFAGGTGNNTDGLVFASTLTNGQVNFVRIDQVEVSGYYGIGILFRSSSVGHGFNDVGMTNVSAHDNKSDGIRVGSLQSTAYSYTNVYIGHATAYNNAGSGINILNTDGAVVERSVVHDNGVQAGIWSSYANNITLQYNESYHNRAGLGFQAHTNNSLLQYNYSHDNGGAGLLVQRVVGPSLSNLTVRYNISENDAGKSSNGIFVSGPVDNVQIHNNVAFASSGHGAPIGIADLNLAPFVRNNIFITAGGVPVVGRAEGRFQGNAYWSSGGAFNLAGYASLAAWRAATGQETLNGQPTGYDIDPILANPGGGGTIGDADRLATLTAYQLQQRSPMIDAGLNLPSLFGVNPGPNDFYGVTLPQYNGYDVGAGEYNGDFPTVPAAPSGLAVTTTGVARADLSWQINSSNHGGFYVERSMDGGAFSRIAIASVAATRYADTSVRPGPTYSYRVRAFNAAGPSGGDTVSVTLSASYLPPGWTSADIGNPGKPGYSVFSLNGGTWAMAGGGTDIWNNADQFRFASEPVSGDGTITARVTSLRETDIWAKSGVMFRDGTAANARFVDVVATSENGVAFQWRSATGGGCDQVNTGGLFSPVWVRLTRSGNSFSGSYSTNGTTWIQIGTAVTIAIPTAARLGLALTAHNNDDLSTSTLESVWDTYTPPAAPLHLTATPGNGLVTLS
jgi:hypothetical protein